MRFLAITIIAAVFSTTPPTQQDRAGGTATLVFRANSLKPSGELRVDGLFYETASGRVTLPAALTAGVRTIGGGRWSGEVRMADGRLIRAAVSSQANAFNISFKAVPDAGVLRWGLAIEAHPDEYY